MQRKRAPGGLAALLILSAAAIGAVILLVALINSNETPVVFPPIDQTNATPLIRVEDKTITSFHLKIARQLKQLRAGKNGFVLPDYGILVEAIELAVFETILARHGHPLTPDAIAEERERGIRESRDREAMRKILNLLDPYPGQYEALMVRPNIANNWIHRLVQEKEVQGEAYAKAEAGLKEATRDPDEFFRSRASSSDYLRIDSRNPPEHVKGPPLPPNMPAPEEPGVKRMELWAKKELADTLPGQLRSTVVDEVGQYLVVRLLERTSDYVVFEEVSYRKIPFETWINAELAKLKGEILDPATGVLLKANIMGSRYGPWLFPAGR